MTPTHRMWAWKTRQINWACSILNRSSDAMTWIEKHTPPVVCNALYRVYWAIDDLAQSWFFRAYEGSWEEIEMAWDYADEDWLSPFQRMVADGRILPEA